MSVAYDLYSSSADFVDDLTDGLIEELARPASRPGVTPRRLHLAPAGPGAEARAVESLPAARPERLAPVAVLRAPSTPAASLHLTRRGVVVLSLLVAALGAALVWVAAVSAPAAQASPTTAPGAAPATVTVHAGDTLWAIASRVAPDADPRAEVAHLRSVNHLGDPDLSPGQVLRLH